jgi:hypothetical protein
MTRLSRAWPWAWVLGKRSVVLRAGSRPAVVSWYSVLLSTFPANNINDILYNVIESPTRDGTAIVSRYR